jgi:hypothetical protein
MPKGKDCPDLTIALSDLRAKERRWSAYGIHNEIANNPTAYHASSSFSYKAVENAMKGQRISQTTRDILTNFVRSRNPDLLPEKNKPVYLNITEFLYCRKNKISSVGEAIAGHYQTYAVSTTADGYVRRGRVSFTFNAKNCSIYMTELQDRPGIIGHPEHTLELEGYAAPKGEYIYSLLRTIGDCQEATAHFYALRPQLRDLKTRRINSMMGYVTHFEPEKTSFQFPTVYLVRRACDEIVCDFIRSDLVTDGSVRSALSMDMHRDKVLEVA